jgi:outer membrane protein TolC
VNLSAGRRSPQRFRLFIGLLLLVLPGVPRAAALTVEDVVREALMASPSVHEARWEVERAALDEPRLLANLDPRFESGWLWRDDRAPRAAPAFMGDRSRDTVWNIDVVQNTLLGTDLRLSWSQERIANPASFRLLDPSVDSRLSLSFRQPLLRYFWGRPDIVRRRRARAGVAAAEARLRGVQETTALAAARAAVEWIAVQEERRIAEAALTVARNLSRVYAEKRRYGLVEESDLLQTQTAVEIQTDELRLAELAVESARLTLAAVLQRHVADEPLTDSSRGEDAPWALPDPPADPADLASAEAAALARRADVSAARAAESSAEWARRMSRLDSLPDLAVVGSYGFAGLDSRASASQREMRSGDFTVRSFGLGLAVPFFGRREVLDRRFAELLADSARRAREAAEQEALRDLRQAWSRRRAARDRRTLRGRIAETESKKLAAAQTDFRRGRAATDLVVRFQQDHARAMVQALRARAEDYLAALELARASGVLLGHFSDRP